MTLETLEAYKLRVPVFTDRDLTPSTGGRVEPAAVPPLFALVSTDLQLRRAFPGWVRLQEQWVREDVSPSQFKSQRMGVGGAGASGDERVSLELGEVPVFLRTGLGPSGNANRLSTAIYIDLD